MSNVKQVGKLLRKNATESGHNIRRISENFPHVERTVDNINPAQSFRHEFIVNSPKPSAKMSIEVVEYPKIDCVTSPIEEYIACQANCNAGGSFWGGGGIPADGTEYPVQYARMDANIGGFTLNPLASGGGVIIPLDGIYSVRGSVSYGSVGWGGAWISLSMRQNGYIIDSAIATQTNGCGICLFYADLTVSATTYCKAGDYVGVWTGAIAGLHFFTPFNFCNWGLIASPTIIELIGQP